MTLTHPEPGFQGHQVFRRQQHRNRAKYTTQSAYCIKQETTGEIIVYARNMESG